MNINPNILKKGDVLLAHNDNRKHTAIYLGDGQIVHASLNEKGTIKGGKVGDQTGKEICIGSNYGEWDFVLRYPDERVATAAALWAVGIANDDTHGYDQVNRWGSEYKPSDFDCSSLVISAFEKQGLPIKKNGGTYTGNMRDAFKRCGFIEVSNMIICSVELPEVYQGDKGEAVKSMQTLLKLRGYDCGAIDGDYGKKTRAALDRFQKNSKPPLTPLDGVCGRGTWRALILG